MEAEPSKEAVEAVEALWAQKHTDMERTALAFDAFAAARVREERERCAKECEAVELQLKAEAMAPYTPQIRLALDQRQYMSPEARCAAAIRARTTESK